MKNVVHIFQCQSNEGILIQRNSFHIQQVLTSSRSLNYLGLQCSKHHLSVWPAMCILSITISTVASFFVIGERSHLTELLA